MKKVIILLLLTMMGSRVFSVSNKDSLSIGFKLEEINNNLGINLDVISPTFLNYFNARISGGYVTEGPAYNSDHFKYTVGLRGYGGKVTDFLKLYGEAGAVFIHKNTNLDIGWYGLFGFEFFTADKNQSPIAYFIELGTNGSAKKELNGFTTNVGLRAYF